MKKLLFGLMGVTLISSTTLSVIACGSNADPENTFKLGYSLPVGHWNTAYTMHSEDHTILANTNATPLASDQYGRIYGDIFELTNTDYSKTNTYIGNHNENFTEFTYKVRSDATWSDYQGNKIATLTASDFLNAAKYVLNASNGSEVISIWTSFIKGTDEIYVASKADPNGSFDSIWEANKAGLGIVVDESANTVTFKLKKSASYFETLLTYSVFSPIYSAAVTNPLADSDYRKGYYSGAFLPTSYVNTGNIILDKNPNYHLVEDTHINRLKYVYITGGSDKTRTLFESKALDAFRPAVADTAGWQKYVGNWENPNATAGMSSSASLDVSSSMTLMFNIYNSNIESTNSAVSQKAVIASRALQNPVVRKFISANLDRSKYVSYFSSAFDKDGEPSKMIRNTYTPDFIESNGKDYVSFLTESLQKKDDFSDIKNGDLADGKEFFYENENYAGGTLQEQLKAVADYFEKDEAIKSYLAANGGKLKLEFPLNPDDNSTLNPKLLDMFAGFNSIAGNQIEIIQSSGVNSANDYKQITNEGKIYLSLSGWSADYADPYTYLSTYRIGGDLENYVGSNRMYKNLDSSVDLSLDENKWDSVKTDINSKVLVETDDVSKNHFELLSNYSQKIKSIDESESEDIRMEHFADEEATLIYENAYLLPIFTKAAPVEFSVSYSQPFSKSTAPYGLGKYRYWDVELNTELLSAEKIKELKAAFESALADVIGDPKLHQNSSAWKA
ncbi:ABC transporter substrate-binding protein [Spiroplasma taiwanense]|uniref:Oligopeptide ABC transporter substrate-binding protein n=1 Tax=Spiroplasma taiwanense CT-1 TaxID=1276220 RepID=S5M0D7_9MOLU|nr:ABC transporter substrate-binding protein [Spiroplasma taiwanense]AGR41457.1 oligopeptide ABC transporter substrate-binding protein [Spiroplasma taiwanense CT-1]